MDATALKILYTLVGGAMVRGAVAHGVMVTLGSYDRATENSILLSSVMNTAGDFDVQLQFSNKRSREVYVTQPTDTNIDY